MGVCEKKERKWSACERERERERALLNETSHWNPRLVHKFKHMFLVFKQHYTYFYTLFHLHVNTKFPNCRKSNNWKEIWFASINLYWCIMSTISISILLQKNTLWFYLLWTWLEQGLFLTLVGRWIEWSSQQISSFELIRDLLFF